MNSDAPLFTVNNLPPHGERLGSQRIWYVPCGEHGCMYVTSELNTPRVFVERTGGGITAGEAEALALAILAAVRDLRERAG